MPRRTIEGRSILLFGVVALGVILLCLPALVGAAEERQNTESSSGVISDFEARLALARLLSYRADKLNEAIREYRILTKERPKDPQIATEMALLLMRQKRYPEAILKLRTALELQPLYPEAVTALARVYLWTGRNEEAAALFGRLSKSYQMPPDASLDMARAYVGSKEYSKASAIYESLLKNSRAPRAIVYTELGNVNLYEGHLQQAIEYYEKALEIDPNAPSARRQQALALSWSGRNEEALPLLNRLHQDDPADKEISVALAHALAATGRAMEAVSTIRALLETYPEDGDLVAELADLEAAAGHAARCRELYLKALSLSGENEKLLLRYAAQMNLWGDFYRVESIYRNYLDAHPGDVDVSLKLGWLLASAQRYEEAEGMYLEMLRQNPQSEKALLDLARLKLLGKDFGRSLLYTERLLEMAPQNREGLFLRGEALFQAGRYEEALPVYKLLADMEPQRARGLLAAGRIWLKKGHPDEAGKSFEAALRREPHDIGVLFWMAGRDKTISSDFQNGLLEPGKESPSQLTEWAQLCASQGHNHAAISLYEEALRRDPESFPARMGLAEILAVDHQYDRSSEILAALASEFPETSKILITQARVLGWSKHYDRSIEIYDHVCRLNPADPVPRKEKARTAAWGKEMGLAVKTYEESYRLPVDSRLTSLVEPAVRETGDPQVTRLYERLRQTSEGGSIYQGYEAFFRDLAKASGRLSPEARAKLEEVRLELLPSYRIQKAAHLESRSKWLAWNRKFTQALDSYEELIGFQPGNEEAIFDYAQVECSLGLCDREAVTYGNLLAIDPLHLLAGMGLERQRIRSEPSIELGHSYWNEEGRGGLSQITRNRTDMTVDIPFSCRYHMNLAVHHWLEDPQTKGITYDAYGPTLGFSGVFNEYLTGAVSWTNKQYVQRGLSPTNTGFAQLWLNLRDNARLGVGYERTDELYNIFGIKQGLQADSFWLGVSSYLTRNLELKGKAQHLNYSDENSGQWYSISAGYSFTDHPRILKLTLSGEYRNTEKDSIYYYTGNELTDITHPYWTPQDYFGTTALLEWNHDLSKHFFCGSELHYYALRLGGGTDTDDNPAFHVEGEWHYEFRNHWSVGIKGLLHNSSQWDASGAWVTIRYRF